MNDLSEILLQNANAGRIFIGLWGVPFPCAVQPAGTAAYSRGSDFSNL
jgi:hypothetical protein